MSYKADLPAGFSSYWRSEKFIFCTVIRVIWDIIIDTNISGSMAYTQEIIFLCLLYSLFLLSDFCISQNVRGNICFSMFSTHISEHKNIQSSMAESSVTEKKSSVIFWICSQLPKRKKFESLKNL